MKVKAIFLTILTAFLWSSVSRSAMNGGEEFDAIKQAIIIDGLQMDSEDDPDDATDVEGTVIYDPDFSAGNAVVNVTGSGKTDYLTQLRKSDKKWHYVTYTIKKRESIWQIAKKFGIDYKMIISANNISKPDSVKAGKTIVIPSKRGVYHTVVKNDTIISISKKYQTDAGLVKTVNNNRTKLYVGEKLFIPEGNKKIAVASSKKKNSKRNVVRNNDDDTKYDKSLRTFSWPLKGKITSGFGKRKNPINGKRQFHNGMDIGAMTGTPVMASQKGRIIEASYRDDYGNMMVVEHENQYITVYAHLSEFKKQIGEEVEEGDVIALSGSTGSVTGPHLHFEIRKDYTIPLNPLRKLK